jgi:hypothetical protein
MPARRLDDEIDRLYQLPLDEFTAARNALAKTGGAGIKALTKPPVAAWAVNQLYWRNRPAYDALVASAGAVRQVHKAVLAGRGGDLRAADKAHDAAVDAALKATLEILRGDGHPATDATRQAILNTLRALPSDDPPGRLTKALQPGGFEMLAGLSVAAGARPAPKKPATPEPDAPKARGTRAAQARAAAVRAKAAVTTAQRALRDAEHAAKREEFEAARTARELEKAERTAEEARAAFEAARETLEEAEAALPAAGRAREAAARRARQADAAVEAARARLEAARAQLDAS